MTTGEKVLILGGVLNLCYATATGLVMTLTKIRGGSISRYLTFAHVGPLMQGPILLGLALALRLSNMGTSLQLLTASMLVASSVLLALGDTVNWLVRVQDEFRERTVGFALSVLSGALFVPAIVLIAIGVVGGLG
jgi:hypothetical protein